MPEIATIVKPSSSMPSQGKPTLSAVATKARLSLATVSYALRGNPKIPSETRKRVIEVAKRMGYIPNPELGRLMYLLRSGQTRRASATIAVLTANQGGTQSKTFQSRFYSGLNDRGAELGFHLDFINVDQGRIAGPRLTQILRSRGIQGVVISSAPSSGFLDSMLDWSLFPVVSACDHTRDLPIPRILPHENRNIQRALSELEKLGCRRMGWIPEIGNLSRPTVTKALIQYAEKLEIVPSPNASVPQGIVAWVSSHNPDAILTTSRERAEEISIQLGALSKRKVEICLLDHPGFGNWAGIDQHPETVGREVIESLSHMIEKGQKGLQAHGTVTMIEGSWRTGTLRLESSATREIKQPPSSVVSNFSELPDTNPITCSPATTRCA